MKLVYLVAGALKCIKTTEEDQNGFLHLKTLNHSECNCSKLLAVIFPLCYIATVMPSLPWVTVLQRKLVTGLQGQVIRF